MCLQVCSRDVMVDDVLAAMETCRSSVSEEDLGQFVKFSGKHAQD